MRTRALRVLFVGPHFDLLMPVLASLTNSVEPRWISKWDELDVHADPPELFVILPGAQPCAFPQTVPFFELLPEHLSKGEALETLFFEAVQGGHCPRPEDKLLGKTEVMARIRGQLRMAAETMFPILFCGENGTGKDLAATIAHELSPHQKGPLVAVNCGAIPTALAESQFFGSVRGAFTGAENRSGYCQQAEGGSLFLDEIGELSLEVQAKLLRALENHEVRRVGCEKSETVNFRLLCATNRDLDHAVENGLFRKDLFYRINVLVLQLPALRERKNDLELLANYFLDLEGPFPTQKPYLTPSAVHKLSEYHWPGNLRQLRNVLQRALVFSTGPKLDADDLALTFP